MYVCVCVVVRKKGAMYRGICVFVYVKTISYLQRYIYIYIYIYIGLCIHE